MKHVCECGREIDLIITSGSPNEAGGAVVEVVGLGGGGEGAHAVHGKAGLMTENDIKDFERLIEQSAQTRRGLFGRRPTVKAEVARMVLSARAAEMLHEIKRLRAEQR